MEKLKLITNEKVEIDIINVIRKLKQHSTKKWHSRGEDDINKVIFHHAAGIIDIYNLAIYHVRPNHISETGCPTVCYHFYIETDGTIYWCNNFTDIVWGAKGANQNSLHVCLNGNLYKGNPTLAQIKSMISVWEWSKSYFQLENKDCFGHYHFGKQNCPGETIEHIIESIRKNIKTKKISYRLTSNKEKQISLKKLGYYGGIIDGIWGLKSKRAVYDFQKENMRLEQVDGWFGTETKKAVRRVLELKNIT